MPSNIQTYKTIYYYKVAHKRFSEDQYTYEAPFQGLDMSEVVES